MTASSAPVPTAPDWRWTLVFPALLLVTFAAYHPAWHGQMLWDDDGHLTRPDLRPWAGLWRIWFELGATQQYYPVVHTTFWVMARLWGDVTLGYHLVNIALHATSATLLVLILRRLRIPGALLAGLLFAVHPVQVESVAWMTELKNTLSGALYLGAALVYLRFDQRRQPWRYVLALGLFCLALLSKSVTATLPAGLLVVFWWQRGRLDWRRDVLPLVPFFLLGAGAGTLTAYVERHYIGAVGSAFELTFVERCLVAGRALTFYLSKLLWPVNLVFMYPRWDVSQAVWWQYLFPLGVGAVAAGLWRLRHLSRAPLAALLFFAVTLAPALGFVNVFPFKYSFVADHFQYLASAGVIALAAAALTIVMDRTPTQVRAVLQGLLFLELGVPLFLLTVRETRPYVDAPTLYRTVIARNPTSWLAHNNLAMVYLKGTAADFQKAVREFEIALEISPREPLVQNNVGTSYYEMNQFEKALAYHREAVRLAPGYAEAWVNLGADLQAMGRDREAIESYRQALEIKPELTFVHANLGIALREIGRPEEASAELRQALAGQPGKSEDHASLADALLQVGRTDDAIVEYQRAVELDPAAPRIRNDLGYALMQAGRLADAEPQLREALRLNPDHAAAHDNLGNILQQSQQLDAALGEYEAALRHGRGIELADIHNDVGVALAKLGRIDDAIGHFREALRIKPAFAKAEGNLRKAMGTRQ